jgi:hypothetical protein
MNAQRQHQKVFVETNHKDHNILSYYAVRTQTAEVWLDVRRSQHNFYYFFFIDIGQILFFFVDIRHCFGLHETQAACACPNLHSKLGASQSFS